MDLISFLGWVALGALIHKLPSPINVVAIVTVVIYLLSKL